MEYSGENGNGAGKVLNFIDARRRLIEEHGTASRGARSPLLEPIRKALNAPANRPLFDVFMYHPDRNFDLIRNLVEDHRIQAPAKDIFQALAHLGIERFSREAREQYRVDYWLQAVETARAGTRLAISAGDWSSAENLWLQLEERAVEYGHPDPKLQQQVLFELAGLLIKRGEYDSATEYYLLCEKLALADRDLMRLASVRIQLGGVYLEQNHPEEALRCFELAAGYAREGALDRDVTANIALGAALAHARMSAPEESLRQLDRALEIAGPAGNPSTRTAALFHRSRILPSLDRHDEAVDNLLAAVRLSAENDNIETRISLLHELFDRCVDCERWGDFFLELLNTMDRVHESEQFHLLGAILVLSAKANTERGLLHLALHNLEEAAYLFQAFEDNERLDEVKKTIENLRSTIVEKKK